MSWNNKIFTLLLILLFLGCKETEKRPEEPLTAWRNSSVIEVSTLLEIIAYPDVKIVDIRPIEAYSKGHIPGAVSFTRDEMTNSKNPIPGMRALPDQLALTLGAKGIANTDTLVLYDDRGNPEAARLWGLLYANGFTNVILLNGGIRAWSARELPVESGSFDYESRTFEFENISGDIWIDTDELHAWLQDNKKNVTLIDTRSSDEYSGKRQKKNAERAGRIPGAHRIDWADAINFHGDLSLKSVEELNELYGKIIQNKSDTVVVYCHSGVRSSFSTFVLTQILDYENVRNYDGSWTAWSREPELPIEQDSITQILK